LLDKKMRNIVDTKAKIVLTGNPGCLIQLKYGVKKYKYDINIKHIVNYLDEIV